MKSIGKNGGTRARGKFWMVLFGMEERASPFHRKGTPSAQNVGNKALDWIKENFLCFV
jgi:hypothetical protein